jgi:hypothetical protein
MALLIEDIELAWSSLRERTDASGWRSISIAKIGPCTLRAGLRFPEKSEALLVSYSPSAVPAAEKLPDGQGFAVSRLDPAGEGLTWLALTRNAHGSTELFAAMVADIAHAMNAEPGSDEKRLLRIFLGRIRAWQEFMRRGAKTLSAEAEIGLVGELTVLRTIIDAGVPPVLALESWVGPLDGVRDFEIGTGAIEVKTTISAVGFLAKIGSLEQLDDSARQPLFLAGVRLSQGETGQDLTAVVADIRDIAAGEAEATRLLNERLIASGYLDAHVDRYIRRFTLIETRFVEVKDIFPRLTPGNVPLGVIEATYQIDLDKAEGPNILAADALKKLGAI